MKTVLTVLGRLMLSAIFLGSGLNKFLDVPSTVSKMQDVDMPMPGILVYGAIVVLFIGGLSILAGFKTRFGAVLLMIFLAMATYYFHDFWNHPDDQAQMIAFMHNLALFGSMLFLVANGPGPGSVDHCCGKGCKSDGAGTNEDAAD